MALLITPAPVRKSIEVAASQQRAFDLFTGRMHRWWPLAHSLLKAPRASITLEPHEGGRWLETATDGSICPWGRVIAWEPPVRVLLAWQLDGTWTFNPDFETEVEIRFTACGPDRTLVELEHRDLERYGDVAEKTRGALDSPDGWAGGLKLFGEFAASDAG